MKKRTLVTAALVATLAGNANAQNTDSVDKQLDDITDALDKTTQEIKLLDFYKDILDSEGDYKRLVRSYEMNMLRGGHDREKDSLRQELKKASITCIDNRIKLMQTACPELQTEQLHAFVNTLLEKENCMNDFSASVKGGSIDAMCEFENKISKCCFSEETLKLDFLNSETIKKVSTAATRAKISADKNPEDYEKEVKANTLRIDEIRLKRLQETLAEAKAAGISYDISLLKNAVIANSNAEMANIGDYERSDLNVQLIPDSRNMIAKAVENMGLAKVAPRSYPENKTISWEKAKIIAGQKTL